MTDNSTLYHAPPSGTPSLAGSGIVLLSLSAEGDFVSGSNAPSDGFVDVLMGHRLSGISERTFGDLVRTVGEVGGKAREQCVLTVGEASACYDVQLWRQEDGTVGVMLVDVTGHDRDSSSVRSLSLELAHRTKNVLAIVLSLANQTARRSPDYEKFKDRFFGHVDALSNAHDIIAATGWQGVTVANIVEKCIGANGGNTTVTVKPHAESMMLKPNAVQNIAIVMRELEAACKASDTVTCDIEETGNGGLDLSWACKGDHDRERLWTDMLCHYAPVSLDGEGDIDFDKDGFRYRLMVGEGQRF